MTDLKDCNHDRITIKRFGKRDMAVCQSCRTRFNVKRAFHNLNNLLRLMNYPAVPDANLLHDSVLAAKKTLKLTVDTPPNSVN